MYPLLSGGRFSEMVWVSRDNPLQRCPGPSGYVLKGTPVDPGDVWHLSLSMWVPSASSMCRGKHPALLQGFCFLVLCDPLLVTKCYKPEGLIMLRIHIREVSAPLLWSMFHFPLLRSDPGSENALLLPPAPVLPVDKRRS